MAGSEQDWAKIVESLGEKEKALERSGSAQAGELALCRSVRQLIKDLMRKFRGSVQWRLLLECLFCVCSLQDFLARKVSRRCRV